ncbi:hypothetical protein N0V93_007533 [Gnomoniopsis smithogilvyi]|uniref:Uncharacterized protein n=1 Tax=Gnomoniopsis smithogilvyi TaxID=1191159 RepID=A0A9W8YTY7_9PEZI|nr:hypothetical protein N0V93_007533 [Gnomoniopsis smithogilvyi]
METRPNHRFDPFGPDAAALGNMSLPDLDGIDWNDPASFGSILGGGLPIPKLASPNEVRREAERRSTRIFASHKDLHSILDRYEAIIQKRWTKKTRSQRQAILLKAWPNMPTVHRPDFDAFKRERQSDRHLGTKHRDAFIWPYINQDDLLARSKTLLLLLNARGRCPPSDFAAADGNAMYLGTITSAIVPIFLNEYVMILNGANSPEEYGKLVAWDDHPDAFNWMTSRKQFLPGEGLMILEAQERLLAFLVNCCKQILHEVAQENLTSTTVPVHPEPQLKTEAETNGFDSLAIMAAEAPYRAPAQLDLGRMVSLLTARTSAAEDHLWALREDPGYFADTLRELKEHRGEMLKDSQGKAHPVLDKAREGIFWSRVLGNTLAEAYLSLETFSELQSQARELQALQAKFAEVISPLEDLPKEFLQALLKFRYYMDQAAKGPLGQLRLCAPASPPLRHRFVRLPPVDVISSKMSIMSRPGLKLDKIEGEVIWLLQTLWEDGKTLFFAKLPLIVDELERVLDAEPKAKDLLSPYIARVIGDLSIISQCLRQLEIYQPWANGFDYALVDYDADIKQDFAKRTTSWAKMFAAVSEKNLSSIVKLADISGGGFAYPIEKRRTKDNVETMRRSETNLDAFWARMDELMHAKAGSLDGSATRHLLSQPRTLQRTPEWVEPAKDEKPSATIDADVDVLSKPMSALYFDLQLSQSGKQDHILTLPRTKTKTRGTAQTTSSTTAANNPEALYSSDTQPTFPVDARALKVFRTVFFSASSTSTPGEVPWNDFLHALTSMGFAAEKLYGSVWQFRPTTLDVERSIQFHEPHPRGKIPFCIARRCGRRLNRAYGWNGGMFILKER